MSRSRPPGSASVVSVGRGQCWSCSPSGSGGGAGGLVEGVPAWENQPRAGVRTQVRGRPGCAVRSPSRGRDVPTLWRRGSPRMAVRSGSPPVPRGRVAACYTDRTVFRATGLLSGRNCRSRVLPEPTLRRLLDAFAVRVRHDMEHNRVEVTIAPEMTDTQLKAANAAIVGGANGDRAAVRLVPPRGYTAEGCGPRHPGGGPTAGDQLLVRTEGLVIVAVRSMARFADQIPPLPRPGHISWRRFEPLAGRTLHLRRHDQDAHRSDWSWRRGPACNDELREPKDMRVTSTVSR